MTPNSSLSCEDPSQLSFNQSLYGIGIGLTNV